MRTVDAEVESSTKNTYTCKHRRVKLDSLEQLRVHHARVIKGLAQLKYDAHMRKCRVRIAAATFGQKPSELQMLLSACIFP